MRSALAALGWGALYLVLCLGYLLLSAWGANS